MNGVGEISPEVVSTLAKTHIGEPSVPDVTPYDHVFRGINCTNLHDDLKTINSDLLQRRDKRRKSRSLSDDILKRMELESRDTYKGATASENEHQRLAALHRMNILDTPNDENFDRIASMFLQRNVPNLISCGRPWQKHIWHQDGSYFFSG